MTTLLITLLAISIAINGILFLIAFTFKSDKLTDASYALSFIALISFALWHADKTSFNLLGWLLVMLWAIRIGSFLVYRIMKKGKDARFDGMRENFWSFGKFWLGQAITAWVLLMPLTLAFKGNGSWHTLSLIGMTVWGVGLLIEAVADYQKYRFSHIASKSHPWIDNGVWRYSRHPNYFGEILVWLGIYLYACVHLTALGLFVGAISPLFIAILLLFVSGIPLLEKSADKKWGALADYRHYKARTSLLIPLPRKKI